MSYQSTTIVSDTSSKKVVVRAIIDNSLDEFVIIRNFSNIVTDIICRFNRDKDSNEVYTDFNCGIDQLPKVQAIFEIMPEVSSYYVSSRGVNFDCVNQLPDDMIPKEVTSGFIHYTAERKGGDKKEIHVQTKALFKDRKSPDDTESMKFPQKISFETNTVKLFPVVLDSGFILCTAYKSTCQLFMTVKDPKRKFVGSCKRYEAGTLIQYIYPLWKFFEVKVTQNGGEIHVPHLTTKHFEVDYPILVKIVYDLSDPTTIGCRTIGVGI